MVSLGPCIFWSAADLPPLLRSQPTDEIVPVGTIATMRAETTPGAPERAQEQSAPPPEPLPPPAKS
jgi:hypothetical protein